MDISKLSLNIEVVLGSSVGRISHLAHAKGCLVYTAGNLVVFYSPILDEQITYLTHTSSSISWIGVSPDEKIVAVCDSGKYGCASVYDIDDLESVKGGIDIKWILRGHKYGIDHLVFSPNSKYILTVSNQDGSMFLWEGAETITRNRNSKAISKVLFDGKGDLVTIGRGYIKIWPFKHGMAIRKQEDDQDIIEGRALSFGKKFSSQDFVDGVLLVRQATEKLILLSSEGLICIFVPGYEKVEKWVDVMMQGAVALELVDSVALCCGDHAFVKAVDLEKLIFKGKFPKPPPTARENLSEEQPLECMQNDEFPKCLGARRVGEFVVTLYANRSMFVWKMEEDGDIQAVRSILSHRAKVTCLNILEEVEGGELIFFASASDDHTVRLWHCYDKEISLPRKSVDVGALLGLKRNVYCKHLTHIIYTHSEHPVTQIKSYGKNAIACIARNELLIYSLENFGLSLLENFDDERLIALQTYKQLILLAMQPNKIVMFEFQDERLLKIRQLKVQPCVERLLVANERLIVNGKGITKCMSLEGSQLNTYYKAERIGVAGNYLLSCEKKALNIYSLSKNKRTTSVTLNHELDDEESIEGVKSNSWLIVLITNQNRLLLLNFSATVLYSEEINSAITDVEITEEGKIILSTEDGAVVIRNQATTAKYKQIDQKVKKWFEQNDMNWMDGSVWASKNRSISASVSGQSQELHKAKSVEEVVKKQKMSEIQIEDSIKLGRGSWAELSVSLKEPEFFNVDLEYKNQDNKRSIFNPTSICAQVNKIYKDVDALQNNRVEPKKPPLSNTSKSSSQKGQSLLEEQKDSSLNNSKPKKRIFNSPKEKEFHPKFTNNLVESIMENPQPKQKMSTAIADPFNTSQRQSSIDFDFSRFEGASIEEDKLEVSRTRENFMKPEFIQSIGELLQMTQSEQTHETLVSMILEHGEEYQMLYQILDKVLGKEERDSRRQVMLKKMEGLWDEMRRMVDKEG